MFYLTFMLGLFKVFILFLGTMSMFFGSMKKNSFIFSWKYLQLNEIFNGEIVIFVDQFSLFFLGVLLLIVFSVNKFSFFYMKDEIFFNRFFWMLMVFVGSMIMVILCPKLIFTLVGWDGLGLTSVLLILYYNSNISWFSGMKTYLMNRLGDGFFMVGLICLLNQGYWKMLTLDKSMMFWAEMIFMLGLFTKSAQYPFSSWLPAAMAAPTPVSALVHSSTLVTAGVYLLFRLSPVLTGSLFFMVGGLGLFTMLMASLSACVESDMKKMIALSTLSQLGLMCFSIGCGLVSMGFYHLLTHAVFKALLFMSAGWILGSFFHYQDVRHLSKTTSHNPMIDLSLVVSCFSLLGFPFLSGFYSKEYIIEKSFLVNKLVFQLLLFLSLPLTVFYSIRMLWICGFSQTLFQRSYISMKNMLIKSVGVLIVCSMLMGNFFSVLFVKKTFFANKNLIFTMMLFGLVLFILFLNMKELNKNMFFSQMCFVTPLNSLFVKKNFYFLGSSFFHADQGLSLSHKVSLVKKSLKWTTTVEKINMIFKKVNIWSWSMLSLLGVILIILF